MENTENNKLIAEFMELTPNMESIFDIGTKQWLDNKGNYFTDDELLYNTSWDWLIPVVEKIENDLKEDKNFEFYNKYILEAGKERMDFLVFRSSKEELHEAIVEFIKWYNKNK